MHFNYLWEPEIRAWQKVNLICIFWSDFVEIFADIFFSFLPFLGFWVFRESNYTWIQCQSFYVFKFLRIQLHHLCVYVYAQIGIDKANLLKHTSFEINFVFMKKCVSVESFSFRQKKNCFWRKKKKEKNSMKKRFLVTFVFVWFFFYCNTFSFFKFAEIKKSLFCQVLELDKEMVF